MSGEESFEMNPFSEAARLDEKLAKFKSRLLVYLSGKYRDRDEHSVDCNIHYAKNIAVELWKMGFAVICPHSNSDHMGYEGADGAFLEGDMVMVGRSDLVVMLENWETSEGAKLERRLAMTLGSPVYFWSTHQLALRRLASNDYRSRDSRAAIVRRAGRIALITGYRPGSVHASPVAGEGNCDACGASWSQGRIAVELEPMRERLERDFGEGNPVEVVAGHLKNRSIQPKGVGGQVAGGQDSVKQLLAPLS